MERYLKVFALALGGAAVTVLAIFGFAIWVFIPLFPAAIVYLVAVWGIRHTATFSEEHAEKRRDKAA